VEKLESWWSTNTADCLIMRTIVYNYTASRDKKAVYSVLILLTCSNAKRMTELSKYIRVEQKHRLTTVVNVYNKES